MEEDMKNEVVEVVTAGVEKMGSSSSYGAATKHIKDALDKQFGPTWHCAMGEGFFFDVTRQTKSSLLMYYGGTLAVLVFKC